MDIDNSDNDNQYDDDPADEDFDPKEYGGVSGESDNDEKYQSDEAADILEDTKFPETSELARKFICIRYPGNVINADRALETLGGLTEISTAVTTPNRRLELRFRPSDGYCKPACGDRHAVSGFLLRVRTKKTRVADILKKNEEKLCENPRNLKSAMPSEEFKPLIEDDVTKLTKELKNYTIQCIPVKMEKNTDDDDDDDDGENSKNNYENSDDDDDENGKLEIDEKSEKTNDKIEYQAQSDLPPTFPQDKYENLSDKFNYNLPKVKILGRIETEFRFTNLCDFQYLPVAKDLNNPDKNRCIYDQLYPSGIPPLKWLDAKVPFFFPPAVFSRMDNIQNLPLKTETKSSGPDNLIGKTRKRRAGLTNFINFNSEKTPTAPPKGIENTMKLKLMNTDHLAKMRELFEQRPIWSKNALIYQTKFTSEQLKLLLPSVAYYFMTGPWRVMWVKLGYDPRIDPSARKYQTLDYRLKSMHGLEQSIKGKRTYTNYILPYKSAPTVKAKAAVLRKVGTQQTSVKRTKISESVYIYKDGEIPPSRQMFYQYCDIQCEEIQEMLRKLPDPRPGTKCHEKRGWLPVGFSDQCREIINKQVKAVLRRKMNIPENHPTTLPRKRARKGFFPMGDDRNRKRSSKKQKEKLQTSDDSDADWEET